MATSKNAFSDVQRKPHGDGLELSYDGVVRAVAPASPNAGPPVCAVALRAQHPVALFCTNPDCVGGTPPFAPVPQSAPVPQPAPQPAPAPQPSSVQICIAAGVSVVPEADCVRLGINGSEVLVLILDAPEQVPLKQLCTVLGTHRHLGDLGTHTHFDVYWIVDASAPLEALRNKWIALPRPCHGCHMPRVAAMAAAG